MVISLVGVGSVCNKNIVKKRVYFCKWLFNNTHRPTAAQEGNKMKKAATATTLSAAIAQLPANSKPLSAIRKGGIWTVTVEAK